MPDNKTVELKILKAILWIYIILCIIIAGLNYGYASKATPEAAALVVHIVTPLLLNNSELYFFTMPLPWTTTPLQLLNSDSTFYISRFPVWGAVGILAALIFYICISVIVLIGTLLFGRRWQLHLMPF